VKAEISVRLIRGDKEILNQTFPCRSFTLWFKRFLANFLTGTGIRGFSNRPVKDITNTDRTMGYQYGVAGNYATHNMAIGDSSAHFEWTQYHLQGFKMWATGLTRSVDVTDEPPSVIFELTGTFQITESFEVKETGLFGQLTDTVGTVRTFLVSRDILASPIPVIPGDVLIVRYRFVIS